MLAPAAVRSLSTPFARPKSLARLASSIAVALAGTAGAQVTLGPVVPLSSVSAGTQLERGCVAVARASNGISLAVWADNRSGEFDVYGSLISASGARITPLGGFPITSTPSRYEGEAHVAACGNTFLVVYGAVLFPDTISSVSDLYAVRIDTAGAILDAPELVIGADPSYLERNVRGVASDGGDMFFVAYHSRLSSLYGEIWGVRILASSGTLLDAPGAINIAPDTGTTLRKNPHASFGDGKFLVTWDDGRDGCRYPGESGCIDVYGRFVDPNSGAFLTPAFPTTSAFSCQEGSSSGFDGTNFVVSHSDERINNCFTADSVAERVTPTGLVLDPTTGTNGMGGSIYVASDPGGFADSIQSGGDVIAAPCATVIAYRDFAAAPSNVSFRVKRLDAGGRLEVDQAPGNTGFPIDTGVFDPSTDPRVRGTAIGPHKYLFAYTLADVPYVRVAQFETPFKRGVISNFISSPRGIAIDPLGRRVVANTGRHRIDVFGVDGVLHLRFGTFGTGNGQFSNPFGVAANSSGAICVADAGNHRVQVFNASGQFQFKFGSLGTGNGQFRSPFGIAVDAAGRIYVADTDNHRVQVFNSSGAFLFKFGSYGTLPGQFRGARAVAVSPSGQIYVVDRDNNRVQVFSSTGAPLSVITAGFAAPRGVALDADGKVFVADTQRNRIVVFTPSGKAHYSFGARGPAVGQLALPMALAVDPAGNSYVAELTNNRIQLFGSVPSLRALPATP